MHLQRPCARPGDVSPLHRVRLHAAHLGQVQQGLDRPTPTAGRTHSSTKRSKLRYNRDCQRDLMEDVEGWEVGTYFGQPLYKTMADDEIQLHQTKRSFHIHSPLWQATSEIGYMQWMSDLGGQGQWYEAYPRI